MNKMLTAIAVSTVTAWAVGYSAMASAQAEFYGRVVAGATYIDGDEDDVGGAWDFGATDQDGGGAQGSRIGFRGETDLGNGLTAGFVIERAVEGGASDNRLEQRHNHLYLRGGFGTVTIGQQNNPYYNARNWDGANYLGGAYDFDTSFREEGIRYSMNTGAFGLNIMAIANDDDGVADSQQNSGVDSWVIGGGYNFGVATVNVAHQSNGTEAAFARDNLAASVAGAAGPVRWQLAYQTSELANAATREDEIDIDSIGGTIAFDMTERDTIYVYHVEHSADLSGDDTDYNLDATTELGEDVTETIFGYSRSLGPGVTFDIAHRTIDNDLAAGTEGDNPKQARGRTKTGFLKSMTEWDAGEA